MSGGSRCFLRQMGHAETGAKRTSIDKPPHRKNLKVAAAQRQGGALAPRSSDAIVRVMSQISYVFGVARRSSLALARCVEGASGERR